MEAYCYYRHSEKRKIWRHIVIIDSEKRKIWRHIVIIDSEKRKIWRHAVVTDTMKTETSYFVLDPSLHWKPAKCSEQ